MFSQTQMITNKFALRVHVNSHWFLRTHLHNVIIKSFETSKLTKVDNFRKKETLEV